MKKELLLLSFLFSILICLPAWADGGDEGEEIIVEYSESGLSHIRGVNNPIHACYYASQSMVAVQFDESMGGVSIILTNLSSQSRSITEVDSSVGSCMVPILNGSGPYRIDFVTEDSGDYYGYFIVM